MIIARNEFKISMPNWFNHDPYLCNFIKVSSNIIWQTCYKLYRICFLYAFNRLNEKTPKIWCFVLTSPFYIIFTDGLFICAYPFVIIYFNIIKTFHLINSKNILGKFYAKTAPCFWIMLQLVLLKMSSRIFFKCSVNSTLFLTSNVVLNF